MFDDPKKSKRSCRLLAKIVFAGSIFLCATKPVYAAPNLVLSTSFNAADGARTYMDIGGAWNGSTEVSGDRFTLSIQNTGADPAYDIRDIPVTVPAGFVRGSSSVTVTDVGGGCPNMTASANQSGAGNPVTINIQSNNSTIINPGCTYNYTFRLRANNNTTAGNKSLGYTVIYNAINNNNGSSASVNTTQNVQVNAGSLSISKSTATTVAGDGDVITYNIAVSSNGSGGLFDVALTDIISSGLNNLTFNVPSPPPGSLGPANVYTFDYLAAGEVVNLTANATVAPAAPSTCPILQNDASVDERTGVSTAASGPVLVDYDYTFTSGLPSSTIVHNSLTSFCELCGDGVVHLTIQNPVDIPLTDLTIVEDLQASGLVYIPGTTTSSVGAAADPVISGTQLTWTSAQIPALANVDPGVANNIEITFGVRRLDEGLVTANRNIIATVDFDVSCNTNRQSVDTGQFELPIRQPVPQVVKLGRNVDAGQGVGNYAATVYGHVEDSVIWRVDVQNTGLADMEDLLVDDTIGGNFDINWVCSSEAAATNATTSTGGAAPAGCVSAGGGTTTSVPDFAVDDPFGNPGNDENAAFVDVSAATSGYIYYVGRIQPACTNHTNNTNIEWGCEINSPPDGGITVPATTGGVPPASTITGAADLSAEVVSSGLDIQQAVTGTNTSQPVGSSGTVTLQFTNLTGATIRNLDFTDTLPVEYVVDPTFVPTAVVTPAYGANYLGMIDTITWDNEDANPLNNTAPHFTLTSTTSRPVSTIAGDDVNLLRHGDVLTVTFRIVVIDVPRYDFIANLDVTPENQGDNTDPDSDFTVTNRVHINFDNICGQTGLTVPDSVQNHPADIEDLDVDTSDALYILTNDPGTPLPLNVLLTNNGGHDADNYTAYVSFGQAMTVQTVPPGCVATTNPPPHPVWNIPTIIPITAAVYACDRGPIAPGSTETITFEVTKAASPAVDDDLTFRVDVIGEVTLSDGTPLNFPAPVALVDTTPNLQLANNYTLDAIRARVLGFNLVKSSWYCAEDGVSEPAPPSDILSGTAGAPNTPAMTGDLNSKIGEDCNYRIESGGWFGFLTPGFTLIAVEDVVVTDDLPDGQGFIPFGGSPFNFTSTPFISPIGGSNYGAGTIPLDETDISWQFNAAGNGIVIKDEFFRVDFKTRLLNDPVDLAYPVPGGYTPNLHSNLSTNIARTSFNARFDSLLGNVTIPVSDSAAIPGYPVQSVRQVDLTEVEPNLIVTKEVCNETLYGVGTGCGNFSTLVDDGDTNDSYIYRVTLTNEASSGGVPRSPAYNVISTDTLDASDLMFIMPFASDNLDNDGDGLIDGADPDGEGSISDNVISNGTPAVITVSNTHSTPLLSVAPGDSVTFYYRVDPDDAIAPLQTLINTVSMSYDSLEGDHGNQNAPQIDNAGAPTSGRARIYTSIDAQANVQMIPLLAQPKRIIAVSNSALTGSPQTVVPGEEIRYELTAELPVANLRNFRIRDELPAGVRCAELQAVNLSTDPAYVGAGFNPGGPPVSTTCTATGASDVVEWNFGDQEVTNAPTTRFDFVISFVARVENTAITNDGVVITNGGTPVNPATCTGGVGVCYVNEAGNPVALEFAPADVIVTEPQIDLVKSFAVANSDAGDVLTVTVTATNNGSAAAYNLRVLDDLVGSDMTYIPGSVSGTDPPDNVDTTTLGANQPIFSWDIANADYEIVPTAVKTFSFDVRVDTTAQPLELLDNTIQAQWNSLPSQNTALNSSGSIGADGSVMGLRNGAVPNAADTINDYENTASASTSVLPLTMTKTDLEPAIVPTIGAHKHFQIAITLPEGTTNNVQVSDDLNSTGLSYVLENNAVFDVTYTFQDIASINGSAPDESALNAFPADNSAGVVAWDIGTVVTNEEDDLTTNAVNPTILIDYYARVNNDTDTDDGDTLQNAVTVTYDNGENNPITVETLNDATPLETVVESLLTVSKSVTNQSNPGADPDGGDTLEYRITIENTGNSTAFDINIVDTLPPELNFDATFTPTVTIDGAAVPGFVSTPTGTPAGPLVWGRGNADNTLDVPATQVLVLTYRAVAQPVTEPNTDLSNSVLVDWTSLDDADPGAAYERTGAGCPAIVVPNDYCVGPAVATLTTTDTNSLSKSVIQDTYTVAPLSTANDATVRIGDIVTFELDLDIQEGLTRSVNVQDVLPAGMKFIDVISINGDTSADYDPPASGPGSNFSYASITAAGVPATNATGTVNWNLGDITNDGAGDATTDTLVIIYRAQVINGAGIPHVGTTTLTNTASMTYIDGNGAPSPADPRLTDTADVIVTQPIVLTSDLSKVRRNGLPSGNTVAAGQTMDFRLSACNSGDAPVYDLQLQDILPNELDETTLTVPVVTINGVAATAGVDYIYTPPAGAGGTLDFLFNNESAAVNPGQCAVIDFDINVAAIGINQVFDNQLQANVYHSLDSDNANQASRETYGPAGPVTFSMNTSSPAIVVPDKALLSPLSHEATIGEEVIYQIKVPGDSGNMNAVMFDVQISDDMASNLSFIDATLDASSTYTGAIDTTASVGNQVRIAISSLPVSGGVTEQAVINIRARVNNDANTNAVTPVPTPAFGNIVSYTFAATSGGSPINGGMGATPAVDDVSIVEPIVTLSSKTVANQTQANAATDAGDILRYSLVIDAAAGATESDAFDISIIDNLPLGMIYQGNPTVTGGNTIVAPVVIGDGINTAQTLTWDLASGSDIDIPEGTSVTVTYDVQVLDSVLAAQTLTNSAQVLWTSLDGASAFERDGSNTPAFNDYFTSLQSASVTTPDSNVISKTRLSDTFGNADAIVRIGDIIDYELRVSLQEGTSPNVIIADTLPQGVAFEETVSVNGITTAPYPAVAPFSHADIAAAVVTGDPVTGPSTVRWTAGNIINAGDNSANDDFVIVYRARVLNLVHPQTDNIALQNDVALDYDTASGAAPTEVSSESLDLRQPDITINKTAAPTGGDNIIDAGEMITYTIDIENTGTAPAYDTELRDVLPVGLRNGASPVTTTSVELVVAGSTLPNLSPVYDAGTGLLIWDFDDGSADTYTIPPGDILRLVYQVQADAGLGAGQSLNNTAQVQFYYSFDDDAVPAQGNATGVREIYGPSNTSQAVLTTDTPNALLKENPADTDASIGETFSYRITVPGVTQPTALHDVRILDSLVLPADAELLYVNVTKVSGSQPWTPVNTGTADDLVIEDTTNGIDIPANEQAVIDVTVTLRDTATNIDGLLFSNAATYTFNQVDNDALTQSNGAGNTTADMRVVEPDLNLDKRGPAGTVNFASPIPYTLVVENIGTGPAFDTTVVDRLPAAADNPPLVGGTCDVAPTNYVVRITTSADESTVVRALTQGSDYTVNVSPAPTCEAVVTTLTDAARIEAGEKLIISYDASLDSGSQTGASLTNIAGVTQWFSLDTAGAGATGEIREYTRTITDGTTSTVDHEDAFTVTVEAPNIDVQKSVVNLTTSQTPGTDASPGDVLRYTVVISNSGIVDADSVVLTDTTPLNTTYVADSVVLNGTPVAQPDGGVSPLIAGVDINSSDIPGVPAPGNGVVSAGESATLTFDVMLDPVIASGTLIQNQAILDSPVTGQLPSDDPNINGDDDPMVIGDEDLTTTLVASAPVFEVQKTSQDMTGDPDVLRAGDTLRYTLTVKNVGNENSINTVLSDQIPANTTYFAGSTTLNGVAVADPVAGVSALETGMAINAPENTTAGFMRADIDVAANNVATITFSVVVDASAVDGTIISNQGFVSGDGEGSGSYPQVPSDDPTTAATDDPTIDIVGNTALFDVQKTVAIVGDGGTAGIVDPGDVLRYTITATNFGAVPITDAVLIDAVPASSQYLANSTTLNSIAVADPAPNTSPLISGIAISSSDLTPPLPSAGNGVLSPGQSAVIVFDVTVDGAAIAGTVISNQGQVSSNELPTEPTDADGIDSNGDQPTDVTVGNAPLISITKQVFVVGGGPAVAGGELEYVVRVTNTGVVPVSNVVIIDDLDQPVAAQMSYIANSGLLNGLPAGVSLAGTTLTADYSTNYGDLPASGVAEFRFRVMLSNGLNIGDTVTNTADVSWNVPPSTASATVSIDIGGIPGTANLNGQVWHDRDFSDDVGVGETLLQGWTVSLYSNAVLLSSTLTDSNGQYQFTGLAPNQLSGNPYEIRFRAPGANANTATLGNASSAFTNTAQQIVGITAASGANVQNLNLPIQPNGVVYDSVERLPAAGIRLTMINQTRSNQPVPASCFDDPVQADQVTRSDGFYKFDLNFSDPGRCAENDEYEIQVQPQSSNFVGTTSVIIPPANPVSAPAFDVTACPGTIADQVPATAQHCENSADALQPAPSVAPTAINYTLKMQFNNQPFTDQIYNNHIPVDPDLGDASAISKVAGILNVTRSQLVPYTITVSNTLSVQLDDLNVIDNYPAGFKYVAGSSRIDDVAVEPQSNGRQLTWDIQSLDVGESKTIKLLLVVGSGVSEGEYVNTAHMINTLTGAAASGIASATVRVIPDPTFDCTDIIGKVYDDKNLNAYQDEGETGLPGVQVATAKGLRVTTDQHGRFHITCAVVPNETRGSNFIMKVDDRTLPSGYRMTTENPRVERATRGKMLKFNFGAAIHRVVRLDLADGVFEKGSTTLRPQWRSRIDMLITELVKDASVLRLSYLGENESEQEVDDRLNAIEELISDRWQELDCCYRLTIEKEVFWRKGDPSQRKEFE